MAVTTLQREALRARHGTTFWLGRHGFDRIGNCRKAQWTATDESGFKVANSGYTLNELKSYLRLRFGRDISFIVNVIW
jgi:hypothetical protein